MGQGNKGVVIGVIVGLVIGFVVGASWGGLGNSIKKDTGAKTSEENKEVELTSGAVTVDDQPASQMVVVAGVTTDKPTWVAVREDNAGAAGDILGAALLPVPGANKDIEVDLLVPTSAGSKYHVSLYSDDGDQIFDNHLDTLLEGDTVFSAT